MLRLFDRDAKDKTLAPDEYRAEIAKRFDALLTGFDQQVLARYYLDLARPEGICRQFGISPEEFRALKVRAKTILTSGIILPHAPPASRGS